MGCLVSVCYDSFLPKWLGIKGIVLYPYILVSTTEQETRPYVIKHEMVHIAQIRRMGMFRFYVTYLYYMARSVLTRCSVRYVFYHNEIEDEAYQLENKRLTIDEINEIKWKGASYGPRHIDEFCI